ncbi:MAG: DUF1385 domain-containing protein [Defluviitaleaceae bacterium]|nr:DUF1385 domain-containing protein [Defluviitaleaceae bacterium]
MANKKEEAMPYGGQAVMEGVMMRGRTAYAMAVRRADGGIAVIEKPLSNTAQRHPVLKWPLIRGVYALISSMSLGFASLSQSADVAFEGIQEEEPPSRFEKFLFDKFGDKIYDVMKWAAMAVAIFLAVGLFFLLPSFIGDVIQRFVPILSPFIGIIEGLIRILIFVGYITVVSRMNDIQRVFQYHGAEHKAISCHEQNLPLTVANVAACPRLHKRCGTSFMLVVMVVSMVLFTALRTVFPDWNMWFGFAARILLLPLVAGISYEISVKWAGSRDNFLVRAIIFPGMLIQRMTTAEPDEKQIEVAVTALKRAIAQDTLPAKALPLPARSRARGRARCIRSRTTMARRVARRRKA